MAISFVRGPVALIIVLVSVYEKVDACRKEEVFVSQRPIAPGAVTQDGGRFATIVIARAVDAAMPVDNFESPMEPDADSRWHA